MKAHIALVLASASLAMAMPARAEPAKDASKQQCFFISQFQTWRAPDAKTIYIRVNMHDYYRLDLGGACPLLLSPTAHLVTKTRGPETVCSAIDWDIRVSDPPGAIEPCIVRKMTRMTPAEVAAIPPKFKP